MHPRNPYRDPPDFVALANAYPPLKPHVELKPNGSSIIDFKNDASQRRLTEALLHRDFGIQLSLPDDRLCPPVPNRLNYVLWIQDIMASAPPAHGCTVRGIDIGTGASAIYPLLACKLEPTWEFTATEIDETSLQSSQANVEANNLQDRIVILRTARDRPILFPVLEGANASFDFTMCNPPFYGSTEELARSAEAKEWGPSAVCTGADVEMIVPGGEVGFVGQMILESLHCRTKCRWYTSMLGKMSSLADLVALLQQHSIDNYAITELVQGQTRRWALGWSFTDTHLPDSIARISNHALQHVLPPRTTLYQSLPTTAAEMLVNELLRALKSTDGVYYRIITETPIVKFSVLVHAMNNTWSRAVRRKNKQSSDLSTPTTTISSSEHPDSREWALKCSVGFTEDDPHFQKRDIGPIKLIFQWVQGRDRALFETFCSHISRKLGVGSPKKL